jgi:hypothetical protein
MTAGSESTAVMITNGRAVIPLQYAAQVASDMLCLLSPQSSHLPDIGISSVAEVAISTPIAATRAPWTVSPMARVKAKKVATIRRVFLDIALKLTNEGSNYQ